MEENEVVQIASVIVPAGEYYVGDPCYGVPNDRWMEWLEVADYLRQHRILTASLDGYPVVGVGTKYGDGSYVGGPGLEFPVDAGLIGIVAKEISKSDPHGMHLVTFVRPFECSYDDWQGRITIGHITIDTEEAGWES